MELQRFLCCSFILEGICLLKPGGYNNSEQTAPIWAVGRADFRLFIWNKLLLFLEQRNTPKCILGEQNKKNVHSLPDYLGKL